MISREAKENYVKLQNSLWPNKLITIDHLDYMDED